MTQNTGKVFVGRLFCGAGILLALIGAFFISVALNILGMVFGIVGYTLGARRLGSASSWERARYPAPTRV